MLTTPGLHPFRHGEELADDYALTCEDGTDHPDLGFRFTLAVTREVTLEVRGGATALELRPSASCRVDGTGLGCTAEAADEPGTLSLDFRTGRLGPLGGGSGDPVRRRSQEAGEDYR
ncbi:MAG: hypothetical protein ACFCGT_05930 [Sandaracinaceae bacterium]